MPQSLAKVLVQIAFSTTHRRPLLRGESIRDETHRSLAGTCKTHESPALIVGGVEDHVCVVCSLGRTITVAELLRELKRSSSNWIKSRDREFSDFRWQAGYGAFSVSQSRGVQVRNYIRNQLEQHKTVSFREKFRALLRRHSMEWDERYAWDRRSGTPSGFAAR